MDFKTLVTTLSNVSKTIESQKTARSLMPAKLDKNKVPGNTPSGGNGAAKDRAPFNPNSTRSGGYPGKSPRTIEEKAQLKAVGLCYRCVKEFHGFDENGKYIPCPEKDYAPMPTNLLVPVTKNS